MLEIYVTLTLALLAGLLLLRKVNIHSTVLTDNAASFVNQTADRLHMRKLVGRARSRGASTIGDLASSSLDEIPVSQATVNDSRAHIAQVSLDADGGTAAVGMTASNVVLTFERGQLFLDPDEAWFMNNLDEVGAPPVRFSWNIWYED